jgi:hypothetical protein
MGPEDLDKAAPLFREIAVADPRSSVFYEILSDSLMWSDETPEVTEERDPRDWWCIRPVLRHRTCLILGIASEFEAWWERARALFPQWIGFLPERCAATSELIAIYQSGSEKLGRDLAKYMKKPGKEPS